jgi:hypothetical protein
MAISTFNIIKIPIRGSPKRLLKKASSELIVWTA